MKNTEKMIAVMRDGRELEIDTNFMFNNQYNTVEKDRIYDLDIHHIINDKRIGLYCCSIKQGTYEEVLEAIKEHRSHIDCCLNCDGENNQCFWYQTKEQLVNEKDKKVYIKNGKKIVDTISHEEYSMYCRRKEDYDDKCVYDMDEEPKLFTEVQYCFFVEYPNGLPDNSDFVKWLRTNHEKCNIVPYWSSATLENCSTLKADVKLGSYTLEILKSPIHGLHFEIANCRDTVRFAYDFKNKKFITRNGSGYKASSYLYKGYNKGVITCWDKFKKLWDKWVELYENSLNN